MVLIDALYINDGGGKILLEYLIDTVKRNNLNCFYLLDHRLETQEINNKDNFIFVKASLYNRYVFYKKNKHKFSKVFCFGNLGPPIKLSIPVFVYLHQRLYLEKRSKSSSIKYRFKWFLKRFIFKLFLKNLDILIVQTNIMKNKFFEEITFTEYHIKVKVLPFYKPIVPNYSVERLNNFYFYPSSGFQYKNHILLLKGFKMFYDKHGIGELHLTVSKEFEEIIKAISDLVQKGYPIINHGFINRDKLQILYQKAKYVVYPSITESLGLPLVEAIDNNCYIIASDLDYVYEVCDPSLVFDPTNEYSIFNSFEHSLKFGLKKSRSKVKNEINELQMLFLENYE